mmetsp:Transcript_26835/g.55723  ORF Transcript_26835/g.55723 Transcript_26835/m.55723 type:complete len:321 (-) Transcript_26835:192-1154(-)
MADGAVRPVELLRHLRAALLWRGSPQRDGVDSRLRAHWTSRMPDERQKLALELQASSVLVQLLMKVTVVVLQGGVVPAQAVQLVSHRLQLRDQLGKLLRGHARSRIALGLEHRLPHVLCQDGRFVQLGGDLADGVLQLPSLSLEVRLSLAVPGFLRLDLVFEPLDFCLPFQELPQRLLKLVLELRDGAFKLLLTLSSVQVRLLELLLQGSNPLLVLLDGVVRHVELLAHGLHLPVHVLHPRLHLLLHPPPLLLLPLVLRAVRVLLGHPVLVLLDLPIPELQDPSEGHPVTVADDANLARYLVDQLLAASSPPAQARLIRN